MDKKVILALGMSLFILIGYQLIMAKLYPQTQGQMAVPQKATIEPEQKESTNIIQESEIPVEKQPLLTDEKEINFENRLYKISFTDIGGGIKKVTLNQNPSCGLTIPYDIFNTKDPQGSLFLFLPDKFGAELNRVKYDVKESIDEIIFTHNFNNELTIEKRFRFYNSLYRMELEISFKNLKGNDITKGYSLISAVHLASSPMEERFLEISANLDNKILKDRKRSRPFNIQKNGVLNWVMIKNRYFSIITRPFIPCSGYFVNQNQNGIITTGLTVQGFDIASNSNIIHKFGIYLGPSDLGLLKQSNITADNALSYGVFGSISEILVSSLRLFHKIVKNWGIAILLLTIFINLFLFPLTRKSYKSMHEMQLLQPKIEKLRQEFKNNPQKLQKEIMELYKKYKINPMGGCLPMVLQMPIFIALYQGLMHSIELRGARFLWIKDLSTPENIKIPVTLPLIGNSINILPILMLIAMFFQQKLSNKLTSISQTDEQRQQQKIMSLMMTIMFGFIFYSFPSGLVLYWLGNTVIMTGFQFVFTKSPRPLE